MWKKTTLRVGIHVCVQKKTSTEMWTPNHVNEITGLSTICVQRGCPPTNCGDHQNTLHGRIPPDGAGGDEVSQRSHKKFSPHTGGVPGGRQRKQTLYTRRGGGGNNVLSSHVLKCPKLRAMFPPPSQRAAVTDRVLHMHRNEGYPQPTQGI